MCTGRDPADEEPRGRVISKSSVPDVNGGDVKGESETTEGSP